LLFSRQEKKGEESKGARHESRQLQGRTALAPLCHCCVLLPQLLMLVRPGHDEPARYPAPAASFAAVNGYRFVEWPLQAKLRPLPAAGGERLWYESTRARPESVALHLARVVCQPCIWARCSAPTPEHAGGSALGGSCNPAAMRTRSARARMPASGVRGSGRPSPALAPHLRPSCGHAR